jgi:Family of unknown function (DUF5681)
MDEAGDGVYTELKNLIVWSKDNGGMGTFYRSRHELIFAFKNGTALTKLPDRNTYAVGHGKPPEARRFKPGQSGNPKGRPKGKRSKTGAAPHERLKSIILEEAYRTIKVNDGPSQVTVRMARAVMRSLAITAAKGNTRAQKLFLELLGNTELSNKLAEDDYLKTMIEYKAEWEMELERRKLHGITALPEPLPHPDEIIVDFQRNTVSIRGPMDKREQADLDLWIKRRHDHECELQTFIEDKTDPVYAPYLHQLESEIAHIKRILEIINTALALRASPDCIQRRLAQLNLKTPSYQLERDLS